MRSIAVPDLEVLKVLSKCLEGVSEVSLKDKFESISVEIKEASSDYNLKAIEAELLP